jgi:hypothetical protein
MNAHHEKPVQSGSAGNRLIYFMRPWSVWSIVLLVIVTGCLLCLVFGKNPSEIGLDEKLQAGKLPLKDLVRDGEWKACAINLTLSCLLLATLRWWAAPITLERARVASIPAWTWGALGLVLIAAAWLRLPRLGHSLWNDEEYTLRTYAWGVHKVRDDGSLEFKKTDYKTVLWYDRGANNHVAFTLAARCSLEIWDRLANSARRPFSEAALRAPAFIAGLGSIVLAGWMLAARGSPLMGTFAAAYLAINPWHLRYSVEARGYAFLLLFLLAATHFLERALKEPAWRNYLLFGLFEFLALYSFPGAVYVLAALNLLAAGLLIARRKTRPLQPALLRWCVTNVFAAMLFVQLMMPCAKQIQLYLQRDIAQAPMTWHWWRDFWSHVVAGSRWDILVDGNERIVSGSSLFTGNAWFPLVAFVVLPAIALIGVVRARTDRSIPHLLVWPTLLAVVVAYFHNSATGNFLFSWYGIYAVLGFTFALAAGIRGMTASLRGAAQMRWAEPVVAVLVLVAAVLATHPAIHVIRSYARQPLRETVEIALGGADPYASSPPQILVASVGTSASHFKSYAPRIQDLASRDVEKNIAGLEELMERAKTEGKTLRVICGGIQKLRSTQGSLAGMIEDSGSFREVQRVDGLEELFSLRIFEYVPEPHTSDV